MMQLTVFIATAILGLGVVALLYRNIVSMPVNHEKAQSIARAIHIGAMTFLREEYRIILLVVSVIACGIGYFMSPLAAAIFCVGSLFSMITGFVGMVAATKANVRTTMAAKMHGEHKAFMVSFFGGGVMGFTVASFGLLGLSCIMHFFGGHPELINMLT
jgi:K(+)-stimulated pyrophosphate-energized sodium pump